MDARTSHGCCVARTARYFTLNAPFSARSGGNAVDSPAAARPGRCSCAGGRGRQITQTQRWQYVIIFRFATEPLLRAKLVFLFFIFCANSRCRYRNRSPSTPTLHRVPRGLKYRKDTTERLLFCVCLFTRILQVVEVSTTLRRFCS